MQENRVSHTIICPKLFKLEFIISFINESEFIFYRVYVLFQHELGIIIRRHNNRVFILINL